ncbi:MAG: hypothetical protein ROW52_03450 [Anaerolineaceae bacterium]|jgi:Tol biopolymer transport system component
MKSKSFDRIVFFILAGLALLLVVIILAGGWIGARPPVADLPTSGAVGMGGPLSLRFPQNMQRSTVEARFHTEPALEGRFQWDEHTLHFWPNDALQAGDVYEVILREGAQTEDGQVIRQEARLSFAVRRPEVVFMMPVTGNAEIWVSSIEASILRPLTQTNGMVYDFGVAADGEHIVYSVRNDMEGLDLWMVDRSGENQILLLDCGRDWCSSPAISPDGTRIAYARRIANIQPGASPGVPRIWMYTMDSVQTAPLYSDQAITGFDPLWSESGDQLAFFDGANGGIRVLTMDTEHEVFLPSNMGMVGSWSPDGQRMMFADMVMASQRPYTVVYEADFKNEVVTPALSSELVRTEYGRPAWSPDSEWIAIGIRAFGGSNTQQIWIMRPDGSDPFAVTSDLTYTNTAYRWHPAGEMLVFQRLKLASAQQTPEVVVWHRRTETFTVLGKDAGFANWLP